MKHDYSYHIQWAMHEHSSCYSGHIGYQTEIYKKIRQKVVYKEPTAMKVFMMALVSIDATLTILAVFYLLFWQYLSAPFFHVSEQILAGRASWAWEFRAMNPDRPPD